MEEGKEIKEVMNFHKNKEIAVAQSAEESRAVAQVQGQILMAKKFPRDETEAFSKIMTACKRRTFAEQSTYAFNRGSAMVIGASIRMAEVLANAWGNLDAGIVELDNKGGVSTMQAFCWDLETNTRITKTFTVRHERKAYKKISQLTDPRDIYELTANMGARRMRACILSIIPGDVVEKAVERCKKTMMGDISEPMEDKIKAIVLSFKEIGVSTANLEEFLGHNISAMIIQEITSLRNIWCSIRDGMSSREDYFKIFSDKPKISSNRAIDTSEKPVLNKMFKKSDISASEKPADIPADIPAEDIKDIKVNPFKEEEEEEEEHLNITVKNILEDMRKKENMRSDFGYLKSFWIRRTDVRQDKNKTKAFLNLITPGGGIFDSAESLETAFNEEHKTFLEGV